MSIFITSEPCWTYIALEVISSHFLSETLRVRNLEGILDYLECKETEKALGGESRGSKPSYLLGCPFEIPSPSGYGVSGGRTKRK